MVSKKKVYPLYSKNQVNEAWKLLIQNNLDNKQREKNLEILNNWRAVHDYPMNTFQSLLRSKVKSHRYSAIIVERLKRTHSILWKLERNPNMMLSRIQDIWGLRVILREVDYIYELRDILYRWKFLHKLIKEDDYIRKPKSSWYRSLHLVYKYYSQYAPEYNWLLIEIQLRTELQHIRATAVETVWVILQKDLKAWEWPKEWLDFFAIASSILAIKEKCVPLDIHQWKDIKDLKESLRILENKLQAIKKLETARHAIKFIDKKLSKKKKLYEYYLLILNIENQTRTILWFKSWELEEATKEYLKQEQTFKDEKKWQVVLVSWESLKILPHAYPNYFLDTERFIVLLKSLLY